MNKYEQCVLYVANIDTEDLSWLDQQEIEQLNSITTEFRKKEWLGGRQAAKCAVQQLTQSQNEVTLQGPIALQNNMQCFYSISHNEDYIVAVSSFQRIGVDVERNRILPDSTIARFVSPNDSDASPILLWTAKEAMSKALGKGQLIDFTKIIVHYPDLTVTFNDQIGVGFTTLHGESIVTVILLEEV